jgi:hypothetical protein
MVATQYKKNMDIADMHTSGRAIMRIIERDIRMAGFEYRDTDAKITYGSISNPLTIKDSGNKCCDEVTVIYDYYDEESKKAERIRIRYWAGLHTSNKGSRHRLYKQKDILGQNKKILAKPRLGTKDVMADYIEDLQFDGESENNNQSKSSSCDNTNICEMFEGMKYIRDQINPDAARQLNKRFNHNGFQIYYPAVINWRGAVIIRNFTRHRTSRFCSNNGSFISLNWPKGGQDYELKGFDAEVCTNPNSCFSKKNQNLSKIYPMCLYSNGSSNTSNGYGFNLISNSAKSCSDAQGKHQKIKYEITSNAKTGELKLRSLLNGVWSDTICTSGTPILVNISLILRTKNQYGKDRQFKKKDYHAGNYKLDKTDKYKRDTFSSTVLVRNLAL